MANYSDLIQTINDSIKANGNQEITGPVLNAVLQAIVSGMSEGALFAGIADTTTNPPVYDGDVFYIATEAGTYVNFGGIEIAEGEAVILSNKTGNWTKTTSGFATQQQLIEFSTSLAGDYFTIKGKYLVAANGDISTTSNPSAITDFLDIRGVEQIIVKGRSGSAVALVAFYDENKTFISSIYGPAYSNKLVTIPKSDFPDNAKYIRANGNNNDSDFLIAESIYSVGQSLNELNVSLNVLKSVSCPLRAYVTGVHDNLIEIDTNARTIKIPNPRACLILSEKYTLRNPSATSAVVLDSSALGNNFFLLFNFDNDAFELAPPGFASDNASHIGVVAVISNSQKRVPYINADSYILDGVSYKKIFNESKINNVYGNAFIKEGYYVQSDNGDISTTSNPSAITDFLDIRGVEQIIVKGRSGSAVALVAFYDENKTFISSIYGPAYSNKLVTIPSEEIPNDAYYMVATGVGDGTDSLQITSLNDLYMRLQNMEKSIHISAILTMGASLMYNGNGWVEDGCSIVGVTPYNKAESGVGVPSYFANLVWRNTYCTDDEFENADILAIQFASSTNMYIENNTKSIEDYESALDTSADNPFESLSHAECLDYILKKWQKKCYEQKDNPDSKWYGTQYGKPCLLLFVTHWHDGRTNYNETIRQVAAKWGGCVCEFDKKIGFSKNQTLYDGRQPSVIYAADTQVLDGVTYGWHPLRGDAGKKYIQRKMANIFADTIKECYSFYL